MERMAKDITGRPIKVGDKVAFVSRLTQSNYSTVYSGTVTVGFVSKIMVYSGGLEEVTVIDSNLDEQNNIKIEAGLLCITARPVTDEIRDKFKLTPKIDTIRHEFSEGLV